MALLLASATTAAADASLTPVVDCVVPQGIDAQTSKVYFGYTNSGVDVSVPFGDSNQIVPGIQFQGQPTVFDTGTYERVFAASWNPTAFTTLAWELNGLTAIANSATPVCVAGITGKSRVHHKSWGLLEVGRTRAHDHDLVLVQGWNRQNSDRVALRRKVADSKSMNGAPVPDK